MEHGCLFFQLLPPVLSLTFECPLLFFFFIFSFCLFLLQHWQSVCFHGDSVARVHDKWNQPPPNHSQTSLFRSVTVSCLSRKYILFSAVSPMSLVFLLSPGSLFLCFLSKKSYSCLLLWIELEDNCGCMSQHTLFQMEGVCYKAWGGEFQDLSFGNHKRNCFIIK